MPHFWTYPHQKTILIHIGHPIIRDATHLDVEIFKVNRGHRAASFQCLLRLQLAIDCSVDFLAIGACIYLIQEFAALCPSSFPSHALLLSLHSFGCFSRLRQKAFYRKLEMIEGAGPDSQISPPKVASSSHKKGWFTGTPKPWCCFSVSPL